MTPFVFTALLAAQSFVLDHAILDAVAAAGTDDDKPADEGSDGAADAPRHQRGSAMRAAGASSTPQGRTFGLGLQLGYPTAIVIKYMLRPDTGIVAGLGGFSGFAYTAGALSLHVDYVWHPMLLTSTDDFALTWYIGGGGNIVVFNNPRQKPFFAAFNYYFFPTNIWLAARVPFGVDLALNQLPFDLYLEAVPSILVFPGVSFGIGAAIGGRYFF